MFRHVCVATCLASVCHGSHASTTWVWGIRVCCSALVYLVPIALQTRIAEYIRQKNVEENYESAMEFNPEVFAQVTMLYVNMDVGTLVRCPSCCIKSG